MYFQLLCKFNFTHKATDLGQHCALSTKVPFCRSLVIWNGWRLYKCNSDFIDVFSLHSSVSRERLNYLPCITLHTLQSYKRSIPWTVTHVSRAVEASDVEDRDSHTDNGNNLKKSKISSKHLVYPMITSRLLSILSLYKSCRHSDNPAMTKQTWQKSMSCTSITPE